MIKRKLSPIHPGEILQQEFLQPFGITEYRLAKDVHVPPRRINEIVRGLRSVTADSALLFGYYFGTSAQFWLNLQSHFDLEKAEHRLKKQLKRNIHPHAIQVKKAKVIF